VVDVRGARPVILRPGALDLVTLARVTPDVVDATEAVDEAGPRASPGLDRRHYAPRTRLVLARSRDAALEEALSRARRGERPGVLLLAPPPAAFEAAVLVRSLGGDSRTYARGLFAALYEFDAAGLDVIVAEPVPEGASWRAVADRLRRASEPASSPRGLY
jgi:L-threonylcarbamoyladenylate synthase